MAAPPPYSENPQYPQGPYPPQQQYQPGLYPPPQDQYPPQEPPPQQQNFISNNTTTVVTTQPAMVPAVPMIFHEFPVSMQCPSCNCQIVTAVHYDVGTLAWVLCLIMCLFGLYICMFIPFCVDSCKDAIHHCPNCSVQLGVFRRM